MSSRKFMFELVTIKRAPPMGGKTKYVLVRLASVITGTSRIWLRERAAEKSAEIFYDPTLGRNVLFKESETVKGKATLPPHVKKKFNLT